MGKADLFKSVDMTADFSSRDQQSDFASQPLGDSHQGRHKLRGAARIEVSRIIAEQQVRQDFDEEHLKTLAHSLKSNGQLQPIRVRWDNKRGVYVVLVGECRFRAAQLAGLTELDCIVHDTELAPDQIHELQLIENLLRQDLNPIEEAQAYRQLKDDRKCSGKELAEKLGLNPTRINRSIRLLTLPEDIQDQVASREIPPTVIREVLKLKDEQQQRELIQRYLSGETTRDGIAQRVKEKRAGTLRTAPQTKKIFISGEIKLQATSKQRVSDQQLVEAIRSWLEQFESENTSQNNAA